MAKIEPLLIEVDVTQALRVIRRIKKARHNIWRKGFWLGWFCAVISTWVGTFIYYLFFK